MEIEAHGAGVDRVWDVFVTGMAGVWKFVHPRIYNYQTLITGIAAVVAAFMTIRQMRVSDAKGDIRHEALVDLALRADRLTLERVITPTIERLNRFVERWSTLDFREPPHDLLERVRLLDYSMLNEVMHTSLGEGGVLSEASNLYDAKLTRIIQDLANAMNQSQVLTRRIVIAEDTGVPHQRTSDEIAIEYRLAEKQFIILVQKRISTIYELRVELRKLAAQYKIDL